MQKNPVFSLCTTHGEHEGEMWFVELKAPKGRLSERQKLFAGDMHRLGQRYCCLWTIAQVDAWAKDRSFVL